MTLYQRRLALAHSEADLRKQGIVSTGSLGCQSYSGNWGKFAGMSHSGDSFSFASRFPASNYCIRSRWILENGDGFSGQDVADPMG